MKRILDTINNTYKIFRLLSDPEISSILENELTKEKRKKATAPKLSRSHAFFHKHYIVQVVN